MVIEPMRVIVGFIDTRKLTDPFPLNTFAPEMCIQLALLLAVKSQFGGAVTLTEK